MAEITGVLAKGSLVECPRDTPVAITWFGNAKLAGPAQFYLVDPVPVSGAAGMVVLKDNVMAMTTGDPVIAYHGLEYRQVYDSSVLMLMAPAAMKVLDAAPGSTMEAFGGGGAEVVADIGGESGVESKPVWPWVLGIGALGLVGIWWWSKE